MTCSSHHVPTRKISISEIKDDLWNFEVQVNRSVWRSLSFRQQSEINAAILSLTHNINATMQQSYESLSSKLAEKANLKDAETNPETSPEVSAETSPKNSGKRKSGDEPDSIAL